MNPFHDDFYDSQTFRGLESRHSEARGITFLSCSFINCAFGETIFRSCKFQDCEFKQCDLSLAQVDGSTFTNTVFEDSKLIGVNWVKASWGKSEIQSRFKSVDFLNCVLNYSTFMGLTLEKIRIKKCTAREVDFSEANLKQADCSFTDFTNSQFRHTDLSEADFRGSSNYFIQPHLNTLKKTRFSLPEAMSLLYNLDIEIGDPFEDEKEQDLSRRNI